MMKMLTGQEIIDQVANKRIFISPFEKNRVNPNSYNLRLSDIILEVVPDKNGVIDPRVPCDVKQVTPIDKDSSIFFGERKLADENAKAFLLEPHKLYLSSTIETTGSDFYVPMLSGRSSVARCGIEVHRTAGFGDIGFCGTWTLEITVVYPTILIAGMEIAQVYFEEPMGQANNKYHGKYQSQTDPQISKFYTEL